MYRQEEHLVGERQKLQAEVCLLCVADSMEELAETVTKGMMVED